MRERRRAVLVVDVAGTLVGNPAGDGVAALRAVRGRFRRVVAWTGAPGLVPAAVRALVDEVAAKDGTMGALDVLGPVVYVDDEPALLRAAARWARARRLELVALPAEALVLMARDPRA